jgi:hypothetical protein
VGCGRRVVVTMYLRVFWSKKSKCIDVRGVLCVGETWDVVGSRLSPI